MSAHALMYRRLLVIASLVAAGAVQAANNAAFVSQDVPALMVPGQVYAVSVTMQNTGTTTWTPGSNYRLGSQAHQDNTRWGMNRVYLPAGTSVAPGASYTFNFNVTSPATASNFQWKMVQDGVAWFGALSTLVVVKTNDAAFVSQQAPPAITSPGQTFPVSVTMQNTGATTWTAAGGYKIAPQNPTDNTNWGVWRMPVPHDVAPGQNVTWNFTATAPANAGTYNFQWKMVNVNAEWFGAQSVNVVVKNGLNAAEFVSQTVPLVTAPGATYPVSVTLKNIGGSTWKASTGHKLAPQNPTDNVTWGIWRIPVPNDVPPGQEVTWNFNIIGPANSGNYNFQWKMVQDTLEWFGPQTPNVVVKNGLNDASFVSQAVPVVMAPGQTYPVSITMQNTGGKTWTPGTNHKLGSQNPPSNTTWGTSLANMPAGASVPLGQSHTFSFNVTAPTTPGTYNFQWRMQDPAEWFGPLTTNLAIKVGLDDAQFISQSGPPSPAAPGQTYPVSVTMRNTGSSTWAAGTVGLGSQDPANNTAWGFNRVPLAAPVAPGQDATFNFTITAPTEPGPYNFRWRMVEGDLSWFGASTPNIAVQNGWDDAAFVSQSVPATMNPGQTYPVSVTLQNSGTIAWAPGTYKLGSLNPQDNTFWGASRVELAGPVAPGANVTFNFNALAPSASGPYNFQWRMLKDSAWFGSTSTNVAVAVGSVQSNMYFIHTDHLNTPRLVANAAGASVWQWDQTEPFGNNPANENPGGAGIFDMPLRFPGQYFDKETNLHYNYFRDYDPGIGRYNESDPIGLAGGLNTYAYVSSAALIQTDFLGLAANPAPGKRGESPCGAVGGRKFPDKFPGFSLTQACINHDRCYDTCRRPKLICDGRFWDDARTQCQGTTPAVRTLCLQTAYQYYSGLFYGGWTAYQDAQRIACKGAGLACRPMQIGDL